MRLPSLDKTAFGLSVVLFAFLYGIATQAFGWFPSDLVRRAWNQAEAVSPVSTSAVTGTRPDFPFRRPQVYNQLGVSADQPERVQRGLTLVSSIWQDFGTRPGLKLIAQDGKVVHKWKINPADIFSRSAVRRGPINLKHRHLHGTYLFPNGDVLVNVEHTGLIRLDACGQVRWKLPIGSDHAITRAEDGSFWVPSVTSDATGETSEKLRSFSGLGRPGNQNQILRVSEEGKVLETFNLLSVLYDNGLASHLFRYASDKKSADILHLNDVEPLPSSIADEYPLFQAGDLLVSLRNINLVVVLDPDNRRVKWHASEPFIRQHDPDYIGDGWIGVFDNRRDGTERGNLLGGSRIVAVQPHTDSTKVIFPTSRSDPFYTPIMGKWQLLENGNLLLTESLAGRIVEVAPDGSTVWEWIAEAYQDSTVAWMQEGTRYSVTENDVSAWRCSPGDSTDNQQETAQ